MKSLLFFMILVVSLFTSCISSNAQNRNKKIPEWISEKGYWVVVSNSKIPKNAVVFFYNNEHQLVYEEAIVGKKLRLNKKKVLIGLKTALESSIAIYEKGDSIKNQAMLAHLFR